MLDAKVETLLAVAKTLNYTKAAQLLSLTQPAVSQHIRHLESEYDTIIFRRGEKPLALTKEGKLLVEYAQKMRNIHDRMLQELGDERKQISLLSVGMTPASVGGRMTRLLADYARRAGQVKVHIFTADGRTLQDMLRNYDIDLAMIEGSVSEAEFLCVPVETEQLFVAVSTKNPLARKSVVTLEDLKRQRLILHTKGSSMRMTFEGQVHALFETIDSLDVIMEIDDNEAIKALTLADYGVSILSDRICRQEVAAGTLVLLPLENKRMLREVNLVCLRQSEHGDTLRELARRYASAT